MVKVFSSFEEAKRDWQIVIKRAALDIPFLLFEWQNAWWQCFGKEKTSHIYVLKKREVPLAILPLMESEGKLTFIGEDLADYLDVITSEEDKASVLRLLLSEIFRQFGQKELSLTNFSHHSITPELLVKLGKKLNFEVSKEKGIKTPCLPLPRSWKEYFSFLSRKNRHELRRKLRRLENFVPSFKILKSGKPTGDIDLFLDLMRKSKPEKAMFLTPRHKLFFKLLVQELPAGVLDLTFLQIDGRTVASILGFWGAKTYYLYNSGFDPEFRHLSVGLILKVLSIKRVIEKGVQIYDFMRGGERYKYQLGAKDKWTYNVTIKK